MLEYGLPATGGEDRRWFIRGGVSPEYRYLHLEEKRKFLPGYKTLHKDMISNYTTKSHGFPAATRESAENVLREFNVNFRLPTGEVR